MAKRRKMSPVEREVMLWSLLFVVLALLLGVALVVSVGLAFGWIWAVIAGALYLVLMHLMGL